MMMLRPYLVGNQFTSWGDHQPLSTLYNNLSKPSQIRIAEHRSKIIYLTFTNKYLADYSSIVLPNSKKKIMTFVLF